MSRKRIVILGAGLAGLSAAWHLQRRGVDCRIFEKESEAGGLCRSKKINGFTFDCDGHLLHFKHRYTFNLVKSLLKDNLAPHQRSAWVYCHGRYGRYPLQANLFGLPPSVIKECLSGFIDALGNGKPKKKNPNFLDWINYTFGEGIARHFMIPYNTKFWTLPPQELTCEWLDGFIPVPSLTQVLEGTLGESQGQFGYNAQFWYLKRGGISQLPLAFAHQIKQIHLNHRITEIDPVKMEIKLASGDKEKFDYLISTIPLPELSHLVKGLPKQTQALFKKLRWNSIFNLNLGIEKKDSSGRHWIYFPQKDVSFFRLGFFHNLSSYLIPPGKSSLYVEVSYSQDKPIDKSNIIPRIKKDLKKMGILADNDRILVQDINDIKYGYPIHDAYYNHTRQEILKYLTRKNIIPCGRYGSWRYFSMEDAVLDGKEVARHL